MPMIGQGGPRASQAVRLPAVLTVAATVFRCAVAWGRLSACIPHRRVPLLGTSSAAPPTCVKHCLFQAVAHCVLLAGTLAASGQVANLPHEDQLRVRIAWGGGMGRLWSGTIAVSDGAVSEPQPLGIEADEPGSMWLESDPHGGAKLVVRQRSPRTYDGVDLLVSAPPTAKLLVRLAPARRYPTGRRRSRFRWPSSPASLSTRNWTTAATACWRCVRRAILLRVRLARDHLVFAPGEKLKFEVEPHGLPLPEGSRARLKVQLLGSGGNELWSQQQDLPADPTATVPVEIPLPGEEGVYDVAIAAATSPNWSQAVRKPLSWKRTIAERRVQVLVLRPQRPPAPPAERGLAPVVEIDPANPRWYEKLNKLSQLQLARARLPALVKPRRADRNLGTVEDRVGQRLPAIAPPSVGRAGRVETQRRLARRQLGSLLAADQPARPAARPRGGLSQRRAADLGAEHPRAERRRGDGAADGWTPAWTTPRKRSARPVRRRAGSTIA